MRALVCGGAGYIGSHLCKALRTAGHQVFVVDDLSTGHRSSVAEAEFFQATILDASALDAAMAFAQPDVVFHFAGLSIVQDSVTDPLSYYRCNVAGSLSLLESMRRHDVARIVFSSSAAVYGKPTVLPIDETLPLAPINPYGSSKMIVERMLDEAALAYGLRSVSLRYFNAAGADPSGDIGESHSPETHLLPNILSVVANGGRLRVFGADYDTPDGTCIRDYVHVNDLAIAHLEAALYTERNLGAHHFNLGTGKGYSVFELIDAVSRVTGCRVDFEVEARRSGDPACLVADSRLAQSELGWKPWLSDLDFLVATAWRWQCNRNY